MPFVVPQQNQPQQPRRQQDTYGAGAGSPQTRIQPMGQVQQAGQQQRQQRQQNPWGRPQQQQQQRSYRPQPYNPYQQYRQQPRQQQQSRQPEYSSYGGYGGGQQQMGPSPYQIPAPPPQQRGQYREPPENFATRPQPIYQPEPVVNPVEAMPDPSQGRGYDPGPVGVGGGYIRRPAMLEDDNFYYKGY